MSWTIPSSHFLRRTESSTEDTEHISPTEMIRSESAEGRSKAEPFVGPSRTTGATIPLRCNPATKVVALSARKKADSEPSAISALSATATGVG
jgi:hypothetical protein